EYSPSLRCCSRWSRWVRAIYPRSGRRRSIRCRLCATSKQDDLGCIEEFLTPRRIRWRHSKEQTNGRRAHDIQRTAFPLLRCSLVSTSARCAFERTSDRKRRNPVRRTPELCCESFGRTLSDELNLLRGTNDLLESLHHPRVTFFERTG